MPVLYDSYCYPTLSDALRVASAEQMIPVPNGVLVPQSFSVQTTFVGTLNVVYYTPTSVTNMSIQRTYQQCESVGPITNGTGLSIVDSVELSFAVIAVWAVAFAFRSMGWAVRDR